MLVVVVLALMSSCEMTLGSPPRIISSDLPAYRLRGDVLPSHYTLDLSTDLDGFVFEGKVWIKLECKTATDTIHLHSSDLAIDEGKVSLKHDITKKDSGDSNEDIPVSKISYDVQNDFLIIKLGKTVIPGQKFILYIPFQGKLNKGLAGYYCSSYFDNTAKSTKWLAVTQFEPMDARRAFPCFDEPAMKAKFSVKLAHKKGLNSVSNMPLKETLPVQDKPGWVKDEYQESVPMSTYLVAFIVSELEYRESDRQPNNVLFRVWARKDALDQVEFARKLGPNILSYYEEYFGVKYPLPKQDMVAVPDFEAGAMENWGMITYRESGLLFDEKKSSQTNQYNILKYIAHELAHQWFGNLVTMRWWTDLWLNEGFATYVGCLGAYHEYPEWNSVQIDAVDSLLYVYKLDALMTSHPVSVPIGRASKISEIFDKISYDKGSLLLRMMNMFLGEKVFRQGVNKYLKKYSYSNAEKDDLWASLTEQAHESGALPQDMTVKQIMDTWTVQTGYPILHVKRDYDSKKAVIDQKRYLAVKGKMEEEKGCWWVPLTFSTPQDLKFETKPRDWLSCGKTSLSIDTGAAEQDWLIFNNKFAGLFRVNYDDRNWQLISDALNGPDYSKIDVLNRVQILADVIDLAWRGDLSYDLAFNLLQYLKQEVEYLPWKAAISGLFNINTMLKRTPNYQHFRKYMKNLLTPIYGKFSRMTDTPNTYEGVEHQKLIFFWACRFDVGDCTKQVSQLFNNCFQNPDAEICDSIPKNLRRIVYCQGVKEGGEEAWDFVWDRYRKSNVGSEKEVFLMALSCTREVWLLNRYLEWSLDETRGIRKQDIYIVFAMVAASDNGFYLAKIFLQQNIKKIHDYIYPQTRTLGIYYIKRLAEQINNEEDLNELKKLTETHKDLLEKNQLVVSQSIETMSVNLSWMKDNYATIGQTLNV